MADAPEISGNVVNLQTGDKELEEFVAAVSQLWDCNPAELWLEKARRKEFAPALIFGRELLNRSVAELRKMLAEPNAIETFGSLAYELAWAGDHFKALFQLCVAAEARLEAYGLPEPECEWRKSPDFT